MCDIESSIESDMFDDLLNLDLDQVDIDQESIHAIDSLEQWLTYPYQKKCEPVEIEVLPDYSQVFSDDISLDKQEWFIIDPTTKRKRCPRLYEFLIMLLLKPHYESYASFTDRSKGIFQIHHPEQVADLWQSVKSRQSNQKMTYDKFARAIRWYYKSNIMQKTNTRYTFQFSSHILKIYFVDENNNAKIV